MELVQTDTYKMENTELAEMARKAGICKEGFERIASSESIEELLFYYIEGIDFCLEHDFPSKEYLKEKGEGVIEKYGIHIDSEVKSRNARNMVLLGDCHAHCVYDTYTVGQLFVKHSTVATVEASDSAYLVIDCFDNSVVNVVASGFSKVLVNVYGNALVEFEEKEASQIKVVRKESKSYV